MQTRPEQTTDRAERAPEKALDRALARAVVARMLRMGLGIPDPAPTGRRESQHAHRALGAAARLLQASDEGPLTDASRAFLATPAPDDPLVAQERLYGHTLRGRVCPYECEYGHRALIQQAHELADLTGFYEAFGLKPSERYRERPDHVACELEFLEFLSSKEAYAIEANEVEMLEVTRQAMYRFLGEHLGRFGRAFSVSLQSADPTGYYGRLGQLCEAFLRIECEHLGVPLGPPTLELRSTTEDEVPIACGSGGASGEDLVQLGAPLSPTIERPS